MIEMVLCEVKFSKSLLSVSTQEVITLYSCRHFSCFEVDPYKSNIVDVGLYVRQSVRALIEVRKQFEVWCLD